MKNRRAEKLASFIQEEISKILLYELDNPLFKQFISITEVELSKDLKRAKIYFRAFNADQEEVKEALNKAKGIIRKLLAERLNIRFVPEIEFEVDKTVEEQARLDALFEKIRKT